MDLTKIINLIYIFIYKHRIKDIKKIATLLSFFFSLFTLAETIHVDEFLEEINIENKISLLLLDSGTTFGDFREDIFKDDFKTIETFSKDQVLWGIFCIKNMTKNKFNLAIRCSKYSSIKLFNDKLILLGESGLYYPMHLRKYNINSISTINFTVASGEKSIFLIKLRLLNQNDFEFNNFPISLSNLNFIEKIKDTKSKFLSLFILGMVLIILFSLILLFKVKKTHYFYLTLLELMVLMYVLAQTGQFEKIIADNYFFHERLTLFFGNLTFLAFILFSEKVLKFHKYDPIALKFAQYLIPFLILVNIPIALEYFISLVFWLDFILIFISINYVIYASYKALKRGDRYALFFLIGNIVLYLGIFISILMTNNSLPKTILGLTSVEILSTCYFIKISLFNGYLVALFKKKNSGIH